MKAILLLAHALLLQPSPEAGHVTVIDAPGSHALLVNPGLLGLMPGQQWALVANGDSANIASALTISRRLFSRVTPAFVLGGFSDSPAGVARQGGALIGGGIGLALSEVFGLGLAYDGRLGAPDAPFDGLQRLRLGAALRPWSWLALGGVVSEAKGGQTHWAGHRELGVGIGLRPLGSWLELDLDLRRDLHSSRSTWVAKLAMNIFSGVLLAPFVEAQDGVLRYGAWLGLRVAGVGALVSGAVGAEGETPGAGMLVHGGTPFTAPALPLPRWTRTLGLKDPSLESPSGRVRLFKRLRDLIEDPQTAAFAIRSGELDWNLSDVFELSALFERARAHGRKLSFFLDGANLKTLLLLRAEDRISLHPGALLNTHGLRSTGIYLADLLEQLGISAQFIHIGRHKSAPEMFTHSEASDDARAQTERWLRAINGLIDRRWDEALGDLRALQLPSLREAKAAARLIAGATVEAFPDWWTSLKRPRELSAPSSRLAGAWGRGSRVAVIPLEGMIMPGHGGSVPLLGLSTIGVADVLGALEQAERDPRVRAIVLRISSGGGSAQASEALHAWVTHHKKTKPIYLSISGLCASGCLYLAAAADRVVVERGALIGSIGIFAGKLEGSALLELIGVGLEEFGDEQHGRSPFALTRPFSEDEEAALRAALQGHYELFIAHLRARGTIPRLDEIADGRVFESAEAAGFGLVDEIAGFVPLLEKLEREAGETLGLWFPKPPSLLERLARLRQFVQVLSDWHVFYLGELLRAP